MAASKLLILVAIFFLTSVVSVVTVPYRSGEPLRHPKSKATPAEIRCNSEPKIRCNTDFFGSLLGRIARVETGIAPSLHEPSGRAIQNYITSLRFRRKAGTSRSSA